MANKTDWRSRIARLFGINGPLNSTDLAAVSIRIDDSPGWGDLTKRPQDYTQTEMTKIYDDALEAWRKNPIAWRIISITTDYVLGDNILISSQNKRLNAFIKRFWSHTQNRMDLRLEPMCDELSRAGDLFVVLFRNEMDGMSYIRFVTKDRIQKIDTAENDWENELAFYEKQDSGDPRIWLSANHPNAAQSSAVMVHYSINRPIGALMGESDLVTMIPWLQRYSRMLEDRVRLHWAMRAFLWMVTVPTDKVKAKLEQYRTPPEAGSIIVKDEAETWEAVNPSLRGADARHDMLSVRNMIDAGSGYPPHWRGEATEANLATATAMQAPTERHLLRRQDYFVFMLLDILYQAYKRAVEAGKARPLPSDDYEKLFNASIPDVSRTDNEMLARSARDLAETFRTLAEQYPRKSRTLARLLTGLIFRFAGVPQMDETLDDILTEGFEEGEETDREEKEGHQDKPKEK
jgi:hypothetical protein